MTVFVYLLLQFVTTFGEESKDWTKYVDLFIIRASYDGMTFQSFPSLCRMTLGNLFQLMENTLTVDQVMRQDPQIYTTKAEYCMTQLLFKVRKQNIMTAVSEKLFRNIYHDKQHLLSHEWMFSFFVEDEALTAFWCLNVSRTLSPKVLMKKLIIFSNYHKDPCTYSLKMQHSGPCKTNPCGATIQKECYYGLCVFLCGIYADFSYFPGRSQVQFTFTFHCKFHFDLSILFDLVGIGGKVHGHVQSLLSKLPLSKAGLIRTAEITDKFGEIVTTWHIIVQKLKQISVKPTQTNRKSDLKVYLFNGPGMKSDKYLLTSSVFSTPSFQCVINLRLQMQAFFHQHITYAAIDLDIAMHREKKLSFSTVETKSSLSAQILRNVVPSVKGLSLQLRVEALKYTGPEMPHCLHGGFMMFDLFLDGKKEQTPLCINNFAMQRNIPTFFSFSEKVPLVIFAFKHYSKINITLDISYTACQVYPIDVCQRYYEHEQQAFIFVSNSLCFIAQITSGSSTGDVCNLRVFFSLNNSNDKRYKLEVSGFLPTYLNANCRTYPAHLEVDVGENSKPISNGSNTIFLSNKTSQETLFEQHHHQIRWDRGRYIFSLTPHHKHALQFRFTLYKFLSLNTKPIVLWLFGGWVYVYFSPIQDERNALKTYQFQQGTSQYYDNEQNKVFFKTVPEERAMIVTTRKSGDPLKVFDNTSLIAVIQTQV